MMANHETTPVIANLQYLVLEYSVSTSGKPMKLQKTCKTTGVKNDPVLR